MNTAETIIELAIREEEYTYQLYKHAEMYTKDKEIIEKLSGLASIEHAHKAKLKSLYEVLTGNEFVDDEIQNMKISDAIIQDDIKFENIKELAEYALSIEDNAEHIYRGLASATSITEIKELFTALANEEAEHKEIFKRLL
ncbi:hypothetical protein K9M79_04620 [Candidatus Woesearchaeota archaeon]|nr:hypothetical protein [Candidatus Woesearchaeota archaeon]